MITSSLDKNIVLKNILEHTKKIMQCEKSSLLLIDQETNELKFAILTNEEDREHLKDIRLKMGEGIAGTVWRQGTALIINDVTQDLRFSNKADQKTEHRTLSIIAAPLVVNGKIIGVMEAINKQGEKKFNKLDLDIIKSLSLQAAVAIENANLYELAITDGLTKLFIHRYFHQRLKEEFNRARRYHNQLSLVMFDIDLFKKLNDTYGHQAGDEVLVQTAAVIKQNCRGSDIACRYGGEEFSIILPETSQEGAFAFAEKIRKKIKNMLVNFQDRSISITISGGISFFENYNVATHFDLLKIADRALYDSKKNGRNQVTLGPSRID